LREHECGRDEADPDVDAEQHTHLAGAIEQAPVERAH
jgi:hypothetical protein